MQPFVFILVLTFAPMAIAQSTMYKCDAAGTITYQGTPCTTGAEKAIRADAPTNPADVKAAKDRLAKAEADQKAEFAAMLDQQQRAYQDHQRAYQAMVERMVLERRKL